MEEVQYCQKKSPGRACYGCVIGLAFRESYKTWAFIREQWIEEERALVHHICDYYHGRWFSKQEFPLAKYGIWFCLFLSDDEFNYPAYAQRRALSMSVDRALCLVCT